MTLLHDASTPPGLRLYAIGDVHGCLDALDGVHEWIARDLADRPAADWRIVHMGDYVDRGPDSRGVVGRLMALCASDRRHTCLQGNHDQMFIGAIRGETRWLALWLEHGGIETLASYGLTREDLEHRIMDGRGLDDMIPADHQAFLDGLGHHVRYGDYYFAHAGIDPEQPLDDQDPHDLMWIREPFLHDSRDHGAVVIHGHTPVRRIDVRPNRIGIDTGAVFGGSLSCIVLEDSSKAQLLPMGPEPLI